MQAENLARFFHTTYEELAPQFNYSTRKASAVPWQDVPENNKRLMIAVSEQVILLFEAEARAEKIALKTLSGLEPVHPSGACVECGSVYLAPGEDPPRCRSCADGL